MFTGPKATPRRIGRPPLDDHDPSVTVCVSVPSRAYDALYQRARDQRVSVPDLIRRSLGVVCRSADDDSEE
jgi:hypothetical protein